MEISSRSWHYRLVKWLDKNYQPSNLCGYFWQVVLSLFVGAMFIPALPLIVTGLGIWTAYTYSYKKVFPHHKPSESEEPSLIVEFIKAKKRRLCPLITVRDESHSPALKEV